MAREADTALDRLGRIARMHPFSQLGCRRDYRSADPHSLINLADEVERRIDSGRVPDAEPYRRLADWVRAPRAAGMVIGAEIDWSFYGATFDTVLFEMWCMQARRELAAVLGSRGWESRPTKRLRRTRIRVAPRRLKWVSTSRGVTRKSTSTEASSGSTRME